MNDRAWATFWASCEGPQNWLKLARCEVCRNCKEVQKMAKHLDIMKQLAMVREMIKNPVSNNRVQLRLVCFLLGQHSLTKGSRLRPHLLNRCI